MLYSLVKLKFFVERVFVWPFVWFGRRKDVLDHRWNGPYDVIFIFPFYHVGGAEQIHLQIAQSMRGKKCAIIFTRHASNEAHLGDFVDTGFDIFDISSYTDDKWKYWNNLVFRGVVARLISRSSVSTIVFNGQSNFAYKVSPWLKQNIIQVELIHSLCSFSYIRTPYISYYKSTIMISKNRIQDHLNLYDKWKVPDGYKNNIIYIPNGIHLPFPAPRVKQRSAELRVLFVARNSPEKRFDLALRAFNALVADGINARLGVIGDFDESCVFKNLDKVDFFGQINNRQEIWNLYANYGDVLLLTSTEEGFPLVVMEAMAFGLAIFATPVGDLPVHVENGVNGMLFTSIMDEDKIIAEAIVFARSFLSGELDGTSRRNIEYAQANFAIGLFEDRYREILMRRQA
jgi:glycosyltransferase involved in cell wall biosynthesis